MCLIAFALDCHPRYGLVLVANRDEFRDRETAPAGFWADAPHVLAGRDKQAGGTWLGMTTDGKLAAVTNYRDARQQVVDPTSRGSLVADYLREPGMIPADVTAHLQQSGNRYDGFNLLYGTWRELHYFTNRGGSSGPVPPGIHALSNHLLDTRWPKALCARERLSSTLQQKEPTADELFLVLADPVPFVAETLPDTGIGPERERFLSPLFIAGDSYGTRSTTVIMVDRDGEVTFAEQGHDTPDASRSYFTFHLPLIKGADPQS
jgi:uncharacterized protein with NRDE domain